MDYGYCTPKEITTVLIIRAGLRVGHWALDCKYAYGSGFHQHPERGVLPGAFVALTAIGLKHYDEPHEFTVDAAKVNPQKKARKKINALPPDR